MNDLWQFDFNTLQFKEIVQSKGSEAVPSAMYGHSLSYYQGSLYLFGGTEGFAFSKKFVRFDLVTKTWEQIVVAQAGQSRIQNSLQSNSPDEMYKHLAVVAHSGGVSRLVVFGGENGAKRFETVHEFNFAEKKWSAVNANNIQFLKARFAHSAAIAHGNGKVYIYGGSSVEGQFFDNVLAYDTYAQSFERVRVSNDTETLPAARDFHQAVLIADPDPAMLIIGGKGKKLLNAEANGRLNEIIKLSLPPESTPYHISLVSQFKPLL